MNKKIVFNPSSPVCKLRKMRRIPCTVLGSLLRLGTCQISSSQAKVAGGYRYGTIANTCGPTDIPGLILILTQKPTRCGQKNLLQSYVSVSLDDSLPQTMNLPAKSLYGQAFRCETTDKGTVQEPATAGRIMVARVGEG